MALLYVPVGKPTFCLSNEVKLHRSASLRVLLDFDVGLYCRRGNPVAVPISRFGQGIENRIALRRQHLIFHTRTVSRVDALYQIVWTSTHDGQTVPLGPENDILAGLALGRNALDLPAAGVPIQARRDGHVHEDVQRVRRPLVRDANAAAAACEEVVVVVAVGRSRSRPCERDVHVLGAAGVLEVRMAEVVHAEAVAAAKQRVVDAGRGVPDQREQREGFVRVQHVLGRGDEFGQDAARA